MLKQLCAAAMLGLIVFLVGCGESVPKDNSVAVSGKLTSGGQPLRVEMAASGAGWVELRFYSLDGSGNMGETYYISRVADDGAFKVLGPSDHGLPPGKYKVIVRQWDPFPSTDKLDGKFDETHSTIVREITGPTTIELDIAKL